MNVNSAAQLLQTGFRTALGASSAIAELLNNPQKLADILAKPPRSPEQLLLDLAARGESIEQEAHKFGETFLSGGSHHLKPPQYIERAGEQCFLQPYDIKGTNLYGFILEGSLHKLQAVCDTYLNQPAKGEVEYRPAMHYVVLTFGTMDSLSSTNKPDSEKGYVLEEEVVFWILTMVGKQVGPAFVVERLAWFMPYVFVNNSPVLISGREVYGISKQLGFFQIPKPPQPPDLFTLQTLLWKHLRPEIQAQEERLIEVCRVGNEASFKPNKTWDTPQKLVNEILELLFDNNGRIEIPGFSLPLNIFDYLTHTAVPVVFLKQFRDAEDGSRACYQAIVENLMKMYKYHSGRILGFGSLGDQFEVTLYDYASHPIVNDLGLRPRGTKPGESVRLPVKLSFWINFNFTVENGTTVWKAPS